MALNPNASNEANTPNPNISQNASFVSNDPLIPTDVPVLAGPCPVIKCAHFVVLNIATIFFGKSRMYVKKKKVCVKLFNFLLTYD
jgi:hypothetical protein